MNFKYNCFSEGQGIPLLFQHGLTANLHQIQSLLEELPGVQLCGIDCPGHGQSKLNGFDPSFDNYADEVIRFLDFLKLDSAVLGGLSMGSGIAVNISLRYPKRVKGLILHRPAWLEKVDPDNLIILKQALSFMGKSDGESEFRSTQAFQKINNDLPAAAKSVMGIFSNTQQDDLPIVINKMVGDSPFKSMDDLKNINVPCLILANEDDPLHPFYIAEIMHEKIDGSSLKKITSRYIEGILHKTQVRDHILTFINQVK
jgi:pimeloyl-ACP methyl ester carboxylesterase